MALFTRLSLFFTALFLAGCAVAPLSMHTTARTNGKGNSMLSVGSTIGVATTSWVPSVRYSIGLTDDFDVGFQYEVVEYGASAKYRLAGHGDEGFAFAALGGTGLSFSSGYYFFAGPVVSYKTGIFEPYFVERFNYVHYSQVDVNVGDVGSIHVDPGNYTYFQHTLGFFLWPLDWLGFGAEASAFGTVGSPFILKGKDKFLFSGQFSFKF